MMLISTRYRPRPKRTCIVDGKHLNLFVFEMFSKSFNVVPTSVKSCLAVPFAKVEIKLVFRQLFSHIQHTDNKVSHTRQKAESVRV